MKIGDKVRVLRGKEEGIITRIIDSKLIEIEIEDGFQIPVLKNEVVVIAQEEGNYFNKEQDDTAPSTATKAQPTKAKGSSAAEGIFLAFRPLNDRVLAVYLLNHSSQQIPYTVFEEDKRGLRGLAVGNLAASSFHKLAEVNLQQFEQWPAYIFQFLFFSPKQETEVKQPLTKKVHFKAASFYRSKRTAPLLNAEAYTFRLDAEASTLKPDDLKESFFAKQESPAALPREKPAHTLDLHIEKLSEHPEQLSKQEMLDLQLNTFEKHLDQAIASGLDEVIYIHGVGNGTLRNALHKHLSKLPEIAYFQDAQKNQFGYGATLIRIK
jgi:DNA-nicking Smr family endonuclease